ncbi:MAG: TlpA family protein disulfide reductase [Fimbriimonas sp.]
MFFLLALGQAPSLDLSLMPSGLFKRIGGYIPYGLKLSEERPPSLKKAPEGAKPRYGTLKVGDRSFLVLLDGANTLYVDSNADGDLTNDPKAEWAKKTFANGSEGWEGSATVELVYKGKATACAIGLYGTDRENELGYYQDFALTGKATLGGKAYDAIYSDSSTQWDGRAGLLMIDKDANGAFHPGLEFYPVDKPFNIAGTTYEMKGLGLVRSTKKVAERTPENSAPPDPNLGNGLRPGKAALAFQATTMSGKPVSFPSSYKGKIVLIDFWATWCGPCMREVPGLVKAYDAYRDKGFEVLGVSLDREKATEGIRSVTAKHGMTWEQIYDGNFFDSKLAKQYGIKSIPATYLVDGDTGKILAMGNDLRGERLAATIEKALAAKAK